MDKGSFVANVHVHKKKQERENSLISQNLFNEKKGIFVFVNIAVRLADKVNYKLNAYWYNESLTKISDVYL